MSRSRRIFVFLLAAALAANCQRLSQRGASPASPSEPPKSPGPPPAEDISGMYSFVGSGEFLQINIEDDGVSGYISRRGDLESDRGAFLDQFFDKASVHGHDVTFTTRMLHGEWFEFRGRFERGPAKSKASESYYILRGSLTEFTSGDEKNAHPHQVEFKWMAQPQDVEEKKPKSKS